MTPPLIIPPPTALSIRYSLTRWDIFRGYLYQLLRKRSLIIWCFLVSGFWVWNDLRAPQLRETTITFKILYSLFLTLSLFCTFAIVLVIWTAGMARFKKFRGLLGEH